MRAALLIMLLAACRSSITSTNPNKPTPEELLTLWTHVTAPANDWFAISGSDANNIFIVGKGGRTLLWGSTGGVEGASGPTSWTEIPTPIPQNLYAVSVTSPSKAVAVGEQGVIITWDGNAWTQQPSPTQEELCGVWSDGTQVYAVGANGTAVSLGVGGYQLVPTDSPDNLFGVAKDKSGPFAVGTLGTVTRWNGSTFKRSALGGYPKTLVAATVGAGGTFVGGVDGGVFNMSRGGAAVMNVPSAFVRSIAAPSPGLLFVVGWDGLLARVKGNSVLSYPDAGDTWLYGVWASSDSDVWAIGADSTILHGPPSVDPAPTGAM